ncbi:Sn1-specific diacylglycerol lipase alpha, partial [Clonorchis sinensis]
VPIAFIVGNALRIAHVLLCYIWLIAHFRESGTFWSRMVYENQPMQKGFIPHNANVATKQQAHEMLSRSIRRRLRRLGAFGRPRCGNEDRQENEEQLAISSAAALFSEFFYDVNLVPSDIVAGLLLLRWQTTQWVGSGHRVPLSVIEQDTKPCTFPAVAADPGAKQVYLSPYFVAVDDVSRCIVIAVRGTLSFEDAIVDLLCDGVRLEEIENVVEEQVGKRPTFVGHRGMVGSARRLFHCLLQENSIEIAKAKRPDYSLVVCGHSLGAGIASFLTLLLRPMYPEIKGYALSAPLGMMNSELANYAKPFLISIIYGFDAFARMNRATVLDFKWRLIDALSACDVPKHRILSRGFELCVSRCCHKGCRTCCCCPIRRPVTVGDDTRLLSTTVRNRLIHPNPDLPLSPGESIILQSGTGDTTEGSVDRPRWPSRLRTGNRSLLCWMDPEITQLFCTNTSVSDHEQTMLDCNIDHPVHSNSQTQQSSNQVPQSYDLRDGVCGGLVLHVVDVAMENCPTHSVDSGSDHFVQSPIYGTERQWLSPRMVNEDEW